MSFQSNFNNYCNTTIPTFLWKDEKALKSLIKLYSELDFPFLIRQIRSYWIKWNRNQILRRNLYEVIESLLNRFSHKQKREIAVESSKKVLDFQINNFTYSDYFYELRLLILLNPSKNIILSVYKNEKTPHAFWCFFDYCIKNDDREFFIDVMKRYIPLYELTYNKEEFRYFDLRSQENIDYILKDLNTINQFLELLSNNSNALFNLIDGYHLPEEKIVNVFSNWDNVLSQKNIKIVIKRYYEDRSFEIDRIIKSSLFISILWTQKDDDKFVKSVFDYINNESRQYYTITKSVLLWLVSYELIDLFFQYNRGVWTILAIYYSLSDKDIQQKKIKGAIYNKYTEIIENNNRKNEEYREQDEKRLNEEERKIKEDINEIISEVTKLENTTKEKYFSSRILYLYKNYKELFEENQVPFVKKQINLYFTSDRTNPWSQYAKVDISGWNQFSWPWFISDLELCIEISISEWRNLWEYIERIIYLIPYLFDSEYENLVKFFNINKIIINDKKHINRLLKVYNHESNHWKLWYLHPYRIISLFNDNILSINVLTKEQKEKLSEICEKMVKTDNERVSMREKESYIEFIIKEAEYLNYLWIKEYNKELSSHVWNYNYYEDYLRNKIKKDDINDFEMFCHTNGALIEISKNKEAIQRRLNQLKWIKTDYIDIMKNWVVHWVTPIENEIIRWRHENKFFYTPLLSAIKFDDYENDVLEILEIAKTFKSDNSEIKKYLYRFVASYYKTVPSKKKINVYAWINNKEFIIYYLWAAYWSEKIKKKYKENVKVIKDKKSIKKREKHIENLEKEINNYKIEIEKLKYEKEELHNKNDELIWKLKELLKENKILNNKVDKLENRTIIITEWKTDWKHLEKIAKEFKKNYPNDSEKFDCFLDNFLIYNFAVGEDKLHDLIWKLAQMFPKYRIIWIVDTDWKTADLLKNYEPNWENIYKSKKIKNVRIVTLPNPRKYGTKKMQNLYKNWRCIELLYNHNLLKDKFILCWELDESNIIEKYWVPFYKFKYNGKNILLKKWWERKWARHSPLYDSNCDPIFYDLKWNSIYPAYDKERFAEEIQWDYSLHIEDIKNFKPLFDILYIAYQQLIIA